MVNFVWSVFEEKKAIARLDGWTSSLRKAVCVCSMRRFQERILGSSKTGVSNSTSDIWLLGLRYSLSQSQDHSSSLSAFQHDFSSRILITYRKGFSTIDDSNYSTDVNWGCMIRTSQMLVAQALLVHKLGRSWRKPLQQKPIDQAYIDILCLFGDSEASAFSIHNLLQAGKAYNLTAGSWVGPYAMCRTWETLVRTKKESDDLENQPLPMALYVVSGDEDGERGGAPLLCIEEASKRCFEFSRGQADWTPILLLVPLVLGLDSVNPRYIPSLLETFTFPQSIGIMGGKPGASTYIVGVQDDKAFYLDPHEVQPAIDIRGNSSDADTSSYHCSLVRHISLDAIDPSLAIGFYCRDKDDFDDLCLRASRLADESEGAPLFTVSQMAKKSSNAVGHNNSDSSGVGNSFDDQMIEDETSHEDDWQLL